MSLQFPEIGERLRAYRLASGLSVEEIASRLGISRAALYRYEKGEVVKIEALARLSQLLDVSVPTLLGVGAEYTASLVAFYERVRQIEERAIHMSVVFGPVSYLLTSDAYDDVFGRVLLEDSPRANREDCERDVRKLLEIFRLRKQAYRRRRPPIVNVVAAPELARFLETGLVANRTTGSIPAERQRLARREIEHLIALIEREPIGIQIGIVRESLPMTSFEILRQPESSVVTTSSFRLGYRPNILSGVATITSAPDALMLYSRMTEELWERAVKGPTAARFLRDLLADKAKQPHAKAVGHRRPR